MHRRSRILVRGLIAALAVGGVALGFNFRNDLKEAEKRVSGVSRTIASRSGRLEYATAGDGPPLLMIHGTGGGFDQGLGFAAGMIGRGRKVIAPSRFGYLGSDLPADASTAAQADALVDLLDHLGIERLPVAGGSAGALSAVEFAIRHPERCSALILIVPAAWAPDRQWVEPGPMLDFVVERLLTSDFLYWLAVKTMPEQLVGSMLATDPALLDRAAPEERARAYRILADVLPLRRRAMGLLNDSRLASSLKPANLDRIKAPTLIISVEDDRFETAKAARYLASRIRGSRLVIYPTGGHIWIGRHQALANEVGRFLAASPY